MKKSKINLKNVISYIQGNVRYYIYYKYSKFKWLVPKYIWEQIEIRINSMNKICYDLGQCEICGCQTTALQFANKACDKPCYPAMLDKRTFYNMLLGSYVVYRDGHFWSIKNNKFINEDKNYKEGI